MNGEGRVTARIRRTNEGDLYHEYILGGVAFGSIEALRTQLRQR